MLEIRPNCERCNVDLPPDSPDARICTYECTFCASCVDGILQNVCPNCGGGFERRPVRPASTHRSGVGLDHQPASDRRVITEYTDEELKAFAATLCDVDPADR
ncbi:MAG: DUF1272 domain-containing protein [Pseudomonadota bacterium]